MFPLASWTLLTPGDSLDTSVVVTRLAVLAACQLVLALVLRVPLRHQVMRGAGVPLNLLGFSLLGLLTLDPLLSRMHPYVRETFVATAVFLGVVVSLKCLDILFFDLMARWRQKPQVPLVLRDIGRWVLVSIAFAMVVRAFFPSVNLNVLAMSSLVVGYIVGNATQDTLGNLVSGLALNVERPFQIGDWVTVNNHTGIVVDTTWRATRLKTKADDYIVIPNASIAKEAIVNFSRPTRNHGCYLTVGVSYETPPNKVRRVILEALASVPEVCPEPGPSVYLTGYGDFAINFTVMFFIADFARLDPIQSTVMDRIWYAFRREGISIPFPIQDCRERDAALDERVAREAVRRSIRDLLVGVDLFQTLSGEELERLVEGVDLQLYADGEKLCRQGDAGDSFFILRRGRVAVWIAREGGAPMLVAHLQDGAFFGEMSLLTGEPRMGTVAAEGDVEVVCISKTVFARLLQSDAGLAGKLAAVLEKRQIEHRERVTQAGVPGPVAPVSELALLGRIRRFFGIEGTGT